MNLISVPARHSSALAPSHRGRNQPSHVKWMPCMYRVVRSTEHAVQCVKTPGLVGMLQVAHSACRRTPGRNGSGGVEALVGRVECMGQPGDFYFSSSWVGVRLTKFPHMCTIVCPAALTRLRNEPSLVNLIAAWRSSKQAAMTRTSSHARIMPISHNSS